MSAFLFLHLHTREYVCVCVCVYLRQLALYSSTPTIFPSGEKKRASSSTLTLRSPLLPRRQMILRSLSRAARARARTSNPPPQPLPSYFHSHQLLALRFSRAESYTTPLQCTKHFRTLCTLHWPNYHEKQIGESVSHSNGLRTALIRDLY